MKKFLLIGLFLFGFLVVGASQALAVTSSYDVGPSITVLSPNGGEVYQAGQQITVKWKSTNITADQQLAVSLSDGTKNIIAAGSTNDGYQVITIPSNIEKSGKFYRIFIECIDTQQQLYEEDFSDNTFTIKSSTLEGTTTGDKTPRIMMWPGAVNQHVDSNGVWQTDSDGVSGGWSSTQYPNDYGDRPVEYCKKFYSNITSVEAYKNETISTWRSKGNLGASTGTRMSYKCVSDTTNASITILSPNGGEKYLPGLQILVKWKTTNMPNARINIGLLNANNVYVDEMTDLTDDGSEIFKLPSVEGQYRFKISTKNYGTVSDMSDNLFTIKSSTLKGTPTEDTTPRISFWPGKVNQHVDIASSSWVTDPDGVSGGHRSTLYSNDYGDRHLEYCKKFYPNTMVVSEYKTETINTWYDRNNVNPQTGTRMSFRCIQNSDTDNGCSNGEVYSSTTGAKCPARNPVVISGISGPITLNVNQTGTWTVKASSPNGGNLSYYVDWGDVYQLYSTSASQSNLSAQQSATFTHSYSQIGTYTPTFTVTNSNGQTAKTSLNVKVINPNDTTLPSGCTSTVGYSPTTGMRCDGNIKNDEGCLPGYKYSPTTGQLCASTVYTQTDSETTTSSSNTESRRSINRTLRLGVKGEDVKILQLFLNLAVDGSFGPETQKKVMEWQEQNGLKVDGLFGSQSIDKAGLDD